MEGNEEGTKVEFSAGASEQICEIVHVGAMPIYTVYLLTLTSGNLNTQK